MEDRLYSFVMRGELTKVSLGGSGTISKHSSSDALSQEYIECLSLDLLDDECVNSAKAMATVYTAIAAFENMVRQFIVKILLEHKGEAWWDECVSDKIKRVAESRQKEEEKIKWHTQRGVSMINYTEFGDLVSIMQKNYDLFEVHIISIDWARQIIQTLERSRNVIMHSGELGHRDIERIGINIRDWISQVGV
jgi:Abi-like protein.